MRAEQIICRRVGKAQRAHHSRMISDRWWARCRFAHPAVLRTDLLPAQAQSRCIAAANQHDGQITSDFQKSCQFQESEIFRFTRGPNQSRNSARLTADEGRWPSSRTRGEMRWTRELQLTCVAQAYGKVVWESSGGEGECRRCHAADRGHCRATRKALADRIPPRMQRATSRLFLPFMHATYCRRCTGTVSEMMTWRPTTL